VAITTVILGLFFRISAFEWVFQSVAICTVFTAELFNTSIERIVNFVSPGFHKQAGEIKDVAAGSVLVASIFAVITGVIIYLPKFIS